MRRTLAAALAGIALLLGGSVALILRLTGPSQRTAPPALPAGEALDGSGPAEEHGTTVEIPVQGVVAPEEAPVSDEAPPIPLAAAEVDLRDDAPGLEALVTKRCGRMRLEILREQGPAPPHTTILLLALETQPGEARIVDSTVHSAGRTRPALVACARWALRGVMIPVPGLQPGRRFQVPVALAL